MKLDHETIKRADEILSRGMCGGLGEDGGQMCIEAAASVLAGEPFSDEPTCVAPVLREYSIKINDAPWSSPAARASGLRSLLLAQLGSQGIDGVEFAKRLAELTIREIIPRLLGELFPGDRAVVEASQRCEREGTSEAAYAATDAAYAATDAAYAAEAAYAAKAAEAAYAAKAAAKAATWAKAEYANAAAFCAAAAANAANADSYLIQSANIAVRVLQEMDAPGCRLLELAK